MPEDRNRLSVTPRGQPPHPPPRVVQSSERTPDRSLYTQTPTAGFAALSTGISR
jgi:hypothetical protein